MAINLRRLFSSKKDVELMQISAEAKDRRTSANRQYEKTGGWNIPTAEVTSEAILEGLVVRAVGRKRLLDGGKESHKMLANYPEFRPSARAMDAEFGKSLRERRRV
jgi:hypothetical protein